MAVFRDITRELPISTAVFAYQTVITIANTHFSKSSLENCRLTALRVNYGIVVAIELDVVVIRDLTHCFILTYRKDSAWQRFHARFVVSFKGIKS
jgi:hypothetical protein